MEYVTLYKLIFTINKNVPLNCSIGHRFNYLEHETTTEVKNPKQIKRTVCITKNRKTETNHPLIPQQKCEHVHEVLRYKIVKQVCFCCAVLRSAKCCVSDAKR